MPVIRPSVRPTCERDIFRTVSPIEFKFRLSVRLVNVISLEPFHQSTSNLKYDISPKIQTLDFGPCTEIKMAAIDLFKVICLVNAISLELFPQSTTKLNIFSYYLEDRR